ncbi:type VI secretion system Vgr family protein [Enterovirga aerilata]|uniref:Type VI secretion system tip protein VgrG n=1 Tax=Enterovirga aerilata TaxID=2730920 RepID=A0A849IBH7_9HYPH|nr:type VI secretion system tip protein TssI/VgrG [Enterovirga sp. DB1703]NNM74641.1 type VI secretion system tip protein VgrG [Enterovirga sp. DB1703]
MPVQIDSSATQAKRIAKLTTPLGQDRLLLHRFEGVEGLSELFEYRAEALSDDMDIDFTGGIGKNCSVSFESYNGGQRQFSGVLTEAQWIGARQERYAYRLTLRPWFWLTGRIAKSRIFKRKTLEQIFNIVFTDNGFRSKVIMKIREATQELEYVTQYRETDLAFVARLAEEYGIYWYFEHKQDDHVLHLIDSLSDLPSAQFGGGGSVLPYNPLAGQDRRDREHIYEWRAERRFRTGRVELRDYDYMQAAKRTLVADKDGTEGYEHSRLEAYDSPGRFTTEAQGKHLARVRLEAEQSLDHRKFASGDAVSLYPGATFSLIGHRADSGEYFVVRANHAFVAEDYRSGPGGDAEEVYRGQYEFQDKARPFRAPQLTPRPRVYGPQTAFVVTESKGSKEEIDVDKEGRIFVNFHWNREDKNDSCSRAVRVAQMWAGKQWGWQVIPRVGMEVVVEFLEGDPDQPLVTGAVYNSDFPYPYTPLPDKKNISGVKTDSTLGHGGYNEFIFDDSKDKEKVQFRAEKDLDSNIRNTEKRRIAENFKGGSSDPSRSTELVHGTDKLKISDGDWDVNVSDSIKIEAKKRIEVICGTSKITITPSEIKVEAGQIKLEGTAEITQNAPMIKLN